MQITIRPEDVEGIWRPLTDAEKATVDGLARYSWLILAHEVPGLVDRVASDEDLADLVRFELAMAIKRVLANPDFTRQMSTTIDDATVSRTIDSAVSAGLLYFPESTLERLRPRRRSGAFSIKPSW